MSWRRRGAAAALVALSILTGCSRDGTSRVTSTTALVAPAPSSPVTTAVADDRPFDTATTCADEGVSSDADFDASTGHYPVLLYGLNPTRRTIAFDVVQVLAGDDAVDAHRRDHPEDPAAPANGSYLMNAFERTDEAALAGDVRVRLSNYGEAPTLAAGTLEQLLRDQNVGRGFVFWIALRDGVVTQLCRDLRVWPAATDGPGDPSIYDPPPGADLNCPAAGTTSRADFDPRSGLYAVYLYAVNPDRRTIAFDVVQLLTGDEAARVWKEQDHPDDPLGPPNDYLIVNAYEHTDEAALARQARVRLLHPSLAVVDAELGDIVTNGHAAGGHPGYGLFWVTLDGGQVTDICQQYTP